MGKEKLVRFRISLGLKQNQMAKEIGVSPSYYYKVESGFRNPSYEFIRKFKKRFPEVDADELFF